MPLQMILVASPSKPFSYTAKNTARRQAIIQDYEPEIEALYAEVETSAQTDIEVPTTWGLSECLDYVRRVVQGVMEREVSDEDDIFQSGCDRHASCSLLVCRHPTDLNTFQSASYLDPELDIARPPDYQERVRAQSLATTCVRRAVNHCARVYCPPRYKCGGSRGL